MSFLWHLIVVAIWVTASSASFYDNNCQIWPNKVIPYCFDSSVEKTYRTQFQAAVKLWTDEGIPITFDNQEECPYFSENLDKMLVVSTDSLKYMASTYGYLNGHHSKGKVQSQELKIGLDYTPHYKFSKSTKFVGAIAHELGRVMCLLNENQRGDLKSELKWHCENLQEYVVADEAGKWSTKYACEDIRNAEVWRENGPWTYAPYPIDDTRYTLSSAVDYDSIMFNNGLPLSRKSKLPGVHHRVITTEKGKKIKGRDWSSGPSDADIKAIKAIWGRSTIPDLPVLEYSIIDPDDEFGKFGKDLE